MAPEEANVDYRRSAEERKIIKVRDECRRRIELEYSPHRQMQILSAKVSRRSLRRFAPELVDTIRLTSNEFLAMQTWFAVMNMTAEAIIRRIKNPQSDLKNIDPADDRNWPTKIEFRNGSWENKLKN